MSDERTIEDEVRAEERESEAADIAAGYPPRRWRCDCGAEHRRGHFQSVGVHRCLGCGYMGDGGTLWAPEGIV
jgi:hypothetical protein